MTQIAERAVRGEPGKLARRLVDCDVHPYLASIQQAYQYMPQSWVERFTAKRASIDIAPHSLRLKHPNGMQSRADAVDPTGRPGGDAHFMAADHLDRHDVRYVVLANTQSAFLSVCLAGPEESNVLCRAINDVFINEWLSVDERYLLAPTIPIQDPIAAAAEIRRVADHPQVICIYMPPGDALMGTRRFDPIYEAIEEVGLPVYSHVSGADFIYQGAPGISGALPESFAERRLLFGQIAQNNLASLIFSGTFERFPNLKVVFAEYGFTWVPSFIWRMDAMWRMLRFETPWVKKWPTEYIHERVRFTTQPVEEPSNPAHMKQMIEMMGDDLLLFSTDYPHWDGDEPSRVFKMLSETARAKIYTDNAVSFLNIQY